MNEQSRKAIVEALRLVEAVWAKSPTTAGEHTALWRARLELQAVLEQRWEKSEGQGPGAEGQVHPWARPMPTAVGQGRGHGHVTPNSDGSKARCGGPGMCSVCSAEAAAKAAQPAPAAEPSTAIDLVCEALSLAMDNPSSDATKAMVEGVLTRARTAARVERMERNAIRAGGSIGYD